MNYTIHTPPEYQRQPLPTKTAWTTALRSGQYKQGKKRLSTPAGDCCLGVLSKVQGRLRENTLGDMVDGRDGTSRSVLSEGNPLYEEIGCHGEIPSGASVELGCRFSHYLVELNDYGLTFDQIADVIDTFWYDPKTEQP